MNKRYECKTCGVISETRDHLCSPKRVDSLEAYCGTAGDASAMCDSIRKTAEYTCSTCGRSAESAAMVCDSIKLH